MEAPYLSGTGGPVWWYARDNEHGWFYHVDEAYNLTGNPQIKNWYRFIAEFRRTSLERLDPIPDRSSRALGHSLNHALQAYKATGDISIPALLFCPSVFFAGRKISLYFSEFYPG
jgi:hypothetical protein